MGRVKVPRCDNCGAPVEFAAGATEARCEYCNEVLIRELAPTAPAPASQWPRSRPPPVVVAPKASVGPFLILGVATLAIVAASSIATFASHVKPLPKAEPAMNEMPAGALLSDRDSMRGHEVDLRKSGAEPTTTSGAATTRSRARTRSTASAAPIVVKSAEPAKSPPFNSAAAVAMLDMAKAKAEASCRGSSGVRLFIQIGFEPDGANRGAAISGSKHKDTPEAKCALRIFRAVRIPPFDPATRPSGLGRSVSL
jgi:hypothetical protein